MTRLPFILFLGITFCFCSCSDKDFLVENNELTVWNISENDSILFDSIIAFNINVDSITGEKKNSQKERSVGEWLLEPPYSCSRRVLNYNQSNELKTLFLDTASFGVSNAACFEPRLAFQFFGEGKEVFRLVVCEDCNGFASTLPIQASKEKYVEYATGDKQNPVYRRYLSGFSEVGKIRLTQLCASLDMIYYKRK